MRERRGGKPILRSTMRSLRIIVVTLLISSGSTTGQIAGTPLGLSVETFTAGFDTPWAIEFAPSGRIFVTGRAGRIRVIEHGRLESQL